MTSLEDEFRFLAGDADRIGRATPLPQVERLSVQVTPQRSMSVLRFCGEQPPRYVFLHGAGLNAHGYDPTVLALDAPALSFDLPGHGKSDWRDDAAYRPDTLAPDVIAAIVQLTSEPFTLVGHSLGGLTAMLVAAALPELVQQLVILDISPGLEPKRDAGSVNEFIIGQRDFASHEEIIDRAIAFGIGHDRAALARGVALNTRQRADGRWEWSHHFAHLESLPATSGTAVRPYEYLWESLTAAHEAGVPIMLVAASQGMVSPEMITEWATYLPSSVTKTLTGPHNLHESAPLALAQLLTSIAKVDTNRPVTEKTVKDAIGTK